MDAKRAVWLLSQMFLIQFDKEEHEALGVAIDALNENAALKARLDKAVELPCKVGDTVYRAVSEWECRHCLKDAFVPYVENFKVGGFYINIRDEIIVLKKFDELYVFGETVFLTEAEAQAKLDEMKGGAK